MKYHQVAKIFQLEKVVAVQFYWDLSEYFVELAEKEEKYIILIIGYAIIVEINGKHN